MAELSNTHAEVRAEAQHKKAIVEKVGDTQAAGLPEPVQSLPGMDVAVFHKPLEGAAGDFYNIVPIDDSRSALLLYDVSGHDSGAGFWGATLNKGLRDGFRYFSHFNALDNIEDALPEIIRISSDAQAEEFENSSISHFATGLTGVFDAENLTLEGVRSGHDPLFLYDATSQKVIELSEDTTPVAEGGRLLKQADPEAWNGILVMVPADEYSTEKFQLESGDIVLGFTDGFFELQNVAGEQYGKERLAEAFEDAVKSGLAPEDILKEVHRRLLDFTGAQPVSDDVSGFVMKIK